MACINPKSTEVVEFPTLEKIKSDWSTGMLGVLTGFENDSYDQKSGWRFRFILSNGDISQKRHWGDCKSYTHILPN